ncbi:MAG: DUF2959 family protein [Planctomycetota bacterium]
MQHSIANRGWVLQGVMGLALAVCGSSCAATKQSASIQRVDELVTRVEAVHVEAELAKKAIYESILTLRPVVTPTAGEPTAQFEVFLGALADSEKQAQRLERTVAPMEQSARQVFAKWEQDLNAFSSDALRSRSRERMQATRARYEAVIRATRASNERYEALNDALRDIALFLSHDFNSAAIAAIAEEAVGLRERAKELGQELDRSMNAAALYVKEAAPIGVAITPVDEPGATDPSASSGDQQGAAQKRTAARNTQRSNG